MKNSNDIKLSIFRWMDIAKEIKDLQDEVYNIIDNLREQLNKDEEVTIKDWSEYKQIPIKDEDIDNINDLCDQLGVEFDFIKQEECSAPDEKRLSRTKIETRLDDIKRYERSLIDIQSGISRSYQDNTE